MNFLEPPPEVSHPNSAMDDEQRAVFCQFVDELSALGVLEPGHEVKRLPRCSVSPRTVNPVSSA